MPRVGTPGENLTGALCTRETANASRVPNIETQVNGHLHARGKSPTTATGLRGWMDPRAQKLNSFARIMLQVHTDFPLCLVTPLPFGITD
jgi:hypothetical protein